MVNWSLTVSDDIDQSVRRFLAEQDDEERDMAAFVEKAGIVRSEITSHQKP